MRPLLCALLFTCAPNRSFVGAGSDAPLVTDAVHSVNSAAGCAWLELGDNVMVFSSDPYLHAECCWAALGCYDAFDGFIILTQPNDYNASVRAQVLLHEMGHAVGLEHQPGIMAPTYAPMPHADAVRSLVETARANRVILCP